MGIALKFVVMKFSSAVGTLLCLVLVKYLDAADILVAGAALGDIGRVGGALVRA